MNKYIYLLWIQICEMVAKYGSPYKLNIYSIQEVGVIDKVIVW